MIPEVYDIAEVERDGVELHRVQLLPVLQLLGDERKRNKDFFGLNFGTLYNISYLSLSLTLAGQIFSLCYRL